MDGRIIFWTEELWSKTNSLTITYQLTGKRNILNSQMLQKVKDPLKSFHWHVVAVDLWYSEAAVVDITPELLMFTRHQLYVSEHVSVWMFTNPPDPSNTGVC